MADCGGRHTAGHAFCGDHCTPVARPRLGPAAGSYLQAVGLGGRAVFNLVGRRSEERRVGKEWVSTCRSRWPPIHSKKHKPEPEVLRHENLLITGLCTAQT